MSSGCFKPVIDRGVLVAVVMRAASRACPFPLRERQFVQFMPAARTGFAAGEEPVRHHDFATQIHREGQEISLLRPAGKGTIENLCLDADDVGKATDAVARSCIIPFIRSCSEVSVWMSSPNSIPPLSGHVLASSARQDRIRHRRVRPGGPSAPDALHFLRPDGPGQAEVEEMPGARASPMKALR